MKQNIFIGLTVLREQIGAVLAQTKPVAVAVGRDDERAVADDRVEALRAKRKRRRQRAARDCGVTEKKRF